MLVLDRSLYYIDYSAKFSKNRKKKFLKNTYIH